MSELRQKIIDINSRNDIDQQTKSQLIFELMNPNLNNKQEEELKPCTHYKRHCDLKCEDCGKFYPCRICHDEKFEYLEKSHVLDRFNIKEIICDFCNLKQTKSNKCIKCGIKFGNYFCNICNLYDDDTSKKQFHCEKCGICRIGGKENFFHCDNCNSCIANSLKDNHICIKNSFHNKCPVCFDSVFNSTKPSTVIKCGHVLHVECLNELLKTGTLSGMRCPLCNKTSIDSQFFFNNWIVCIK